MPYMIIQHFYEKNNLEKKLRERGVREGRLIRERERERERERDEEREIGRKIALKEN